MREYTPGESLSDERVATSLDQLHHRFSEQLLLNLGVQIQSLFLPAIEVLEKQCQCHFDRCTYSRCPCSISTSFQLQALFARQRREAKRTSRKNKNAFILRIWFKDCRCLRNASPPTLVKKIFIVNSISKNVCVCKIGTKQDWRGCSCSCIPWDRHYGVFDLTNSICTSGYGVRYVSWRQHGSNPTSTVHYRCWRDAKKVNTTTHIHEKNEINQNPSSRSMYPTGSILKLSSKLRDLSPAL